MLNAVYCLYEAKKLSEISLGVGPSTDVAVLTHGADGGTQLRSIQLGVVVLENLYKQFGPQPFNPTPEQLSTLDKAIGGQPPTA